MTNDILHATATLALRLHTNFQLSHASDQAVVTRRT